MSEPQDDKTTRADPVRPQETIREKLESTVLDRLCPTTCGYRISMGTFCVSPAGSYSAHVPGRPCNIHMSLARVVADAVLPIVEEETKTLRRDLDIAESVARVAQVNYREQYDRVLEWALRDQRRAGTAEDALSALRDKVKALADENDDTLCDVIETALDDAHGASHYECCYTGHVLAHKATVAAQAVVRALVEPQGGEGQ